MKAGDKFWFRTHRGRTGLAFVREVSSDAWRSRKISTVWFDGNGKHYEWFREGDFMEMQYA